MNPGVFSLSAFDAALIRDGFQSAGNRRLGFIYPDNMDVALSAYLEEQIGAYEAVDLSAEFSLLQMVHSPEEIGLFRDAVRMHEQVFRALPAVMHSGMSETECVNLLRDVFYRYGCGDLTRWIDCWTDLISNPDGMPLSGEEVLFPGRILQKGDRIDVAVHAIGPNAVYAMCARSFLLGDAPAAETQALWETAVGAQQAAAAALRPGATVKAAAEAANSYLRTHGAAEDVSAFIHAVGYGMDERPRLWDDSENMPLQAGMVLAVMPTADNGRVTPLCCGDVFVVTETGAQRLGTLEQEIFPVYGVY